MATSPHAPSHAHAHALGVSARFIRQFLERVEPHETTSDVCERIVKPETRALSGPFTDRIHDDDHHHDDGRQALVGPATVFVSHAWKYEFRLPCEVMLEYAKDHPDAFFWFDIFVNDQNSTDVKAHDWWSTTFKTSIRSIGAVLLVLSPWSDPVPLTRAWCLWEILCAVDQSVKFLVRLPPSETAPFVAALSEDAKVVMDTLVRVQAEKADAQNPRDRNMIFAAVKESTGGFTALNTKVKDQLRLWLLNTAQSAVEDMEARGVTSGPEYAGLCVNVGHILREHGDPAKAIEYVQRGLTTESINDPAKLASCFTTIANAYNDKGEFDRALEYSQQGLDMQLEQFGEEHKTTASSYNNMAIAHLGKGDHELGISLHEKSLEIRKRVLGDAHPDTAASLNNVGNAYTKANEFGKAIACFRQALQIYSETLGDKHPTVGMLLGNIASAYYSVGDYDKAIECQERSLAIKSSTLGESHPSIAPTLWGLGGAFYSKGLYDRAIEYNTQALAICRFAHGEQHPDTATCHSNLGDALFRKTDFRGAAAAFESCLAIRRAVLGPRHIDTQRAENRLEDAQSAQSAHGTTTPKAQPGARSTEGNDHCCSIL